MLLFPQHASIAACCSSIVPVTRLANSMSSEVIRIRHRSATFFVPPLHENLTPNHGPASRRLSSGASEERGPVGPCTLPVSMVQSNGGIHVESISLVGPSPLASRPLSKRNSQFLCLFRPSRVSFGTFPTNSRKLALAILSCR